MTGRTHHLTIKFVLTVPNLVAATNIDVGLGGVSLNLGKGAVSSGTHRYIVLKELADTLRPLVKSGKRTTARTIRIGNGCVDV